MRALLFVAAIIVACPVAYGGDDDASFDMLAARARRAGLRVLAGDHLTLATDRPARAGDGVDTLPAIFDQAWAAWCDHYGLDPRGHRDWRAFGCLVVDRERFRAAGLLPESIPDFTNGHCHGDRFWLADQSNPDYRRHLLLHEGVHAFTLTLRGLATPTWYTEGIAEYLATHRLDAAAEGGGRFVATPLPSQAGDVEQLGRIERIRSLRTAGTCPGLEEIFAARAADHRDLSAYAASWAAVALLARHPRHAVAFAAAERGPLDAAFTNRLREAPGWDAAAARDFDAFTDEVDYGYDPSRSAIDWSPGDRLTSRQTIGVDGSHGWQNAGWSLEQGRRYDVNAEGRCAVGFSSGGEAKAAARPPRRLESTADGISLRWYRGRPVGRLLVAQWLEEPPGGGRPRFVVLAEGGRDSFTAAADGPVYCKINDPPGELADNEGRLAVTLAPAE